MFGTAGAAEHTTMPVPKHDAARPDPGAFAASAAQLALLLVTIRALALEQSFGLVAITPLVFVGFCVHAWLPARLKLPFFLALSLAAFVLVLGPAPGALLVALGLGLVGLCHLPVAFGLRVVLLIGAGGLLAAARLEWIDLPWAAAVVPVLAAMFMFRTILYLYDLRTEGRPASVWLRLSYFFLLPNVCFLLFPVVDYRTFQRTYYDAEPERIHARGLRWILRGIVHLLCYRVVYLWLTPTVAEIQDLASVTRFVVSSYLLYLRISGHFHLIVGLLHLFGFHLPETNHRYLFASSFTDCWRRINVYWSEFLKKVVYFPTFARLRRRGVLLAMASGTALTFVATWLLHAYQWFWLHGDVPLATDGLFWGAAGALALGNMLWEARRGGAAGGARLKPRVPSWTRAARRSLQAFGMFAVICTIWSLWCCSSLEQWLALLSQARRAPAAQVQALAGAVGVVLAVGTLGQRIALTRLGRAGVALGRGRVVTAAAALALALLTQPGVQAALGPSLVAAVAPLQGETLNARDQERLVAGYYDRLIDREGFGGRVAETTRLDPDDPEVFAESSLSAGAEGPLRYALAPSAEETFQEAVVTTNRFGMRDREYTQEKPADTFRIAILGACYEMGTGVSNDEVWEAVAERWLERELTPSTGRHYEVLNFSVPGYDLLQLVTLVREKVPAFEPDLVVVSNHVRSSVEFVLRRAKDASEWPAGLAEMVEATRQRTGVDWEAELESWAFTAIVAACEEAGARPVLVNVPALESLLGLLTPDLQRRIDDQLRRASELGFEVLDLGDAFAGQTYQAMATPGLQRSPSPAGHRRLAERFCQALLAQPDGLGAR